MPRFYRKGFPRRMSLGRRPIQSYKNISTEGPGSRVAATNIVHLFAKGVDNYTGPTASLFNEVPTGAKIFSVDIQVAFSNLTSVSSQLTFSIQLLRSGQTVINPKAQGGDSNRNNVIYTRAVFIGKDQNNNFHFRVKIPKGHQRIREDDQFYIVYQADTTFTSYTQAIYKFYR